MKDLDQLVYRHVLELSETFDAVQIIAKMSDELGGEIYVGRKGGKIKLGTAEKFWSRVDRTLGTEGCWPFSGGYKAKGGHGQVVIGTRNNGGSLVGAHRLAWILTNGPIPMGLCVCHRCDNPPCCNPSHLFLATSLENFNDMRRKGRARGGSLAGHKNRNAKLNEKQVREIRIKYRAGMSQSELGREYGVVQTAISYIVSQGGWKHV